MNSPEIERERVTLDEAAPAQVTIVAPPSGEQLIPEIVKPNAWAKIVLKPRVDSFNQAELLKELQAVSDSGAERIALDFTQNRFVSVAVIRACVETAAKLREVGGELALVGCSERGKRHFSVYGSMDDIRIVRSEADLERIKRSPVKTRAS